MQTVAAEAMAAGADTLITCGGVQSNHARVTAAAGAALGLQRRSSSCNGARREPSTDTGNARLDRLFGADVRFVASREERAPRDGGGRRGAARRRPVAVHRAARRVHADRRARLRARRRRDRRRRPRRPDVIVHASSSGGTQAGLIAGCALFGLRARVIGVSADDPAGGRWRPSIRDLLDGDGRRGSARSRRRSAPIARSTSTTRRSAAATACRRRHRPKRSKLVARREGIVLDPAYTAKAMAGLIARVRAGAFGRDDTVLFWHTGGTPGTSGSGDLGSGDLEI